MFDGMLSGVRQDRINFLAEFLKPFYNWAPGNPTPSDDVITYAKSIAWVASPLATQQCIVAFGTTDFRRDLAMIKVPVLIVHGDDDRIVPLAVSGERAAALTDGSRLEVIRGRRTGSALAWRGAEPADAAVPVLLTRSQLPESLSFASSSSSRTRRASA